MKRIGMIKRTFWLTLCGGLAVIAAVIAVMEMRPSLAARIDRGVYDILLRGMAHGEPSNVPILADIDERSLEALGQWPWPRYITAEIAAALYEAGAKAVAMDILLSEEDRTSLVSIARELDENFGVSIDLSHVPPEVEDNDKYFADILAQIPAVVSIQLMPERWGSYTSADVRPFPVTEFRAPDADTLAEFLPRWGGAILPVPTISKAVAHHAPMNAIADDDGIFRRVPLFMNVDGAPVPGLALTALAIAAEDKGIVVHVAEHGPVSARVAGIDIPIAEDGTLPVAFRGGGGVFPTYSAVDILNGEIDPALIAGRIVFLGSTAAGLRDLRPTPLDTNYPGLELHAAAIDTILSERFIRDADWKTGINVFAVPLLGLAALIAAGMAPPLAAFASVGAAAAAVWMLCAREFEAGTYVSPVYPLASLILCALVAFSVRYFTEEKDKRVLRRAFANYVSPEVVGRIVERGGVASIAGETRNISVLFTDLRGFTSMTEKMSPTDVSAMLGLYFTPMTHIVRSSGGTLDKFVGDALMAFWNAPLDVPDHPSAAVGALMEMQTALEELNGDLEPRFGVRLRMGGGIHSGDAHVGNMGTEDLMDYTAIGDTVNTASRVEGMCSKYGVGIAVSGDTASRLDSSRFSLVQLDLVRVKGRKGGTPIYTVMTPEEAARREAEIAAWSRAFGLYIDGDFAAAGAVCSRLAKEHADEKRYAMFAERSAMLLKARPAEWDGIFTYESK